MVLFITYEVNNVNFVIFNSRLFAIIFIIQDASFYEEVAKYYYYELLTKYLTTSFILFEQLFLKVRMKNK